MATGEHPGWEPRRLREHRESLGLTQDQVAEQLTLLTQSDGFGRPLSASAEMVRRHELGLAFPGPRYRRAYSALYRTTSGALGFHRVLPFETAEPFTSQGYDAGILRVPSHLRSGRGPSRAEPHEDEVTAAIHGLLACVETPDDDGRRVVELPPFDLENRILSSWTTGKPQSHAPVLMLVAGYAGSGKTEFGRFVSEATGWTLLDKDSLTRPMTESLLRSLEADPNDRHTDVYLTKVRPLEYRCLLDAAFDNLALGISAVVTAPFLVEVTNGPWLQRLKGRCAKGGIELAVVWMYCDTESMRDYLEARDAARDSWKLSYWEDYASTVDSDVRPVCSHYVVDNRTHARTSLAEQARHMAELVRHAS